MAGKGIIVYYSWTGNTAAVAKEIQAITGFDIKPIVETKERKKGNIAMTAMGAFFGMKNSIEPMDFQFKDYDQILLGAQVWAGKTPPAINSFLGKADFSGKKVLLFLTKADPKVPEKVIDSIRKIIEQKGGIFKGSISFTTTMNNVITKDKFGDELKAWLDENIIR